MQTRPPTMPPQAQPARLPARAHEVRPPCCFSIDFEDYAHDFQRALGISRPRHAPHSLWKAYECIERFAQERLAGGRLTFFTTGQVARDHPDIVRRIASDGHEVACHYYEHDQIWHQDRDTLCHNLDLAVEHLCKASGQVIKGFRAPDFSIDDRCASWAYEELSRHFIYDSSLVAVRPPGSAAHPHVFRFPGSRLHEFPIVLRRLAPGVAVRVVGGTYLRVLPIATIMRLLREVWTAGYLPHVYLHPYDVLDEYEQWSSFAELAELPLRSRCYWWARQHQWHTIGNRNALRKLARIFGEFRHTGPMASLLSSDEDRGGESDQPVATRLDVEGRAIASVEPAR
jgi:Polysaccharide deacetylase/Domain of unknown function (DUF3473)